MNKAYITITFQSESDLADFLGYTTELITSILQYSNGVRSTIATGIIEPVVFPGSGEVNQFWVDFLSGKPLNPEFAEKDKNAED